MRSRSTLWPCPTCASVSGVIDTRPAPDGTVRRRRLCTECGQRWTTYEVTVEAWDRLVRRAHIGDRIVALVAQEADQRAPLATL